MSSADRRHQPGARVVVEHVRRVHPGPIVAVEDVSLTVEPGEFVALTGPSGSGKSSLLSLIGGLDRPSSGRVEIDGHCVSESRRLAQLHRDVVAFVFQHHYLLSHLSARDNVELPLVGAGVGAHRRHGRAEQLLAEVGLQNRGHLLARHLSGGERQRVAIARALANEPALLLADEPTGSLDSASAQRILDVIEAVRERRQLTLLVVTYDPAVADRADRMLHLLDGRLVDPEQVPALRGQKPRG